MSALLFHVAICALLTASQLMTVSLLLSSACVDACHEHTVHVKNSRYKLPYGSFTWSCGISPI